MGMITQFLESTLQPVVVIFTASNLAVMGLQANMPEVVAALKSKKTMALIFFSGWVLGPALAYLITRFLPLEEPYVIGLLLYSLAPCAPFLPLMIPRARGDMSFAGALVPLVAIGTVIFMPLMAPVLIDEVSLSAGDIAKMLLVTVLLPLSIGAALRGFSETTANRIFPAINLIAKFSALITIGYAVVLYWREMLETAGSFGLLSMTIFMVLIGLITYRFGFGLKQDQRSAMSLGMLTRNGSVVLLAALAIPNVDPGVVTYVIMFIVWSIVLAAIAAKIFGRLADRQNQTQSGKLA
ncbi:MAG: bile acid:sodium symporter family protein [Pseudomonadales bacterium]